MPKSITSPDDFGIEIWKWFDCRIQIKDRLMGGIPHSPELIKGWLGSKFAEEKDRDKIAKATASELKEMADSKEDGTWNGFKFDEKEGLYVESRQVKAMIKEAASVLRVKLGIAAFKAKVAERIFIEPDKIFLGRMEPDGREERPISAMTAMGPINALKRTDYIETPVLEFRIKALNDPLVAKNKDKIHPEAYLPLLLGYAQDNGFGADRSQGYGQFHMEKFEMANQNGTPSPQEEI